MTDLEKMLAENWVSVVEDITTEELNEQLIDSDMILINADNNSDKSEKL